MNKLFALAILAVTASAQAATYTFGTLDQGWYRDDAFHSPSNPNTITGYYAGQEYRSFFAFDLSSIPNDEVIVGVSFIYNTFDVIGDDPVLFQISDVSTNYADLVAGTGGMTAVNDLATGSQYGLQALLTGEDNVVKTFSLNSTAIADATAAGSSPFILGGSIVFAGNSEYVMGFSNQYGHNFLEVTTVPCVPEPASMAVLGLGLAALKRRRARKA